MTKQPPQEDVAVYGHPTGEPPREAHGMPHPVEDAQASEPCATDKGGNSEGKEAALAVGCNANNGNASARTANCNNAASNGNDNYAGAFAVHRIEERNGKHLTSRATSPNTTDDRTATGGYGLAEYRPLPFWDGVGEGAVGHGAKPTEAIAEGTAQILRELGEANEKRKLKNLKRFITDPGIVRMGVERCLERAADSPEARRIAKDKDGTVMRIVRELTEETYRCEKPRRRIIVKRGKGDKNRNADVYTLYDRCVQNVLLIVMQQKLTRKLTRWCYSGVEGRGLWSNDRRYCLVNRIRTYVKGHADASVGLTDIRHFYESLRPKVALGVLFDTVVCPYTRRLLCDTLMQTETLAIGGTLSQLVAMLVLSEMDEELTRRFRPQFYATFGDNRIIMDEDREKVVAAVHWEMSYLEGRYGMSMKNDWQIVRANGGFSFCKQRFDGGYVNVRAEIRHRAIRGAIRGKQHYAGYKGMLMKTDSRRLRHMIEEDLNNLRMKNKKGMAVRPMTGELVKLNKVDGKRICIIDYAIRKNNKDSEYFVRFQFVVMEEDGSRRLCVANNGSYEIKEFFGLVREGAVSLPLKTRVRSDGNSFYFEDFHTSNKEACELICAELGI